VSGGEGKPIKTLRPIDKALKRAKVMVYNLTGKRIAK
jgi:hypothetical protein